MPLTTSSANRLVADIGGTNTRLALFDPVAGELRSLSNYVNRDYGQPSDIIHIWLDALREPRPAACCLAVAAPPCGDQITMLNIDWSFSAREIAERFGFSTLRCINDFEANAHALPHLADNDLTTVQRGKRSGAAKLATIGAGTGLGGATLTRAAGAVSASASEPGHMGLAAATDVELELFRYLLKQHEEIYAELLLSGPGLQRLYQSLADIQGEDPPPLPPEVISARALTGQCELCALTLNTFCALLGSISGDYVLANGAYGGLYLAGGFLPNMLPFLQNSTFLQRFQNKGKMRDHLVEVPLYAITSPVTGLLGAAHAPL
ncbi:MAG: glucokinase [Halioglobus sp.]|nr:glucokinase [Halioglobus sp.]